MGSRNKEAEPELVLKVAALKEEIGRCWQHDFERSLELSDELRKLSQQIEAFGTESPLSSAEISTLLQQIIADETQIDVVYTLPCATHREIANQLKQLVDENRWRNDELAAKYAELIIDIGEASGDKSITGLGKMALGDTVAREGSKQRTAWRLLLDSAQLFLQNGDLIGWARTCTGRVGICTEMNEVKAAMADAERAMKIFRHYAENELFVRLAKNMIRVFNDLGRFRQSIQLFNEASLMAEQMGEPGKLHLGILYNNVGVSYRLKGDLHEAKPYFFKAKELFVQQGRVDGIDIVNFNLAHIEQSHGQYAQALHHLHQILAHHQGTTSIYSIHLKMYIAECYLALNKDREARELANEIMQDFQLLEQPLLYEMAHTLRYLALAEAKLGNLQEAESSLKKGQKLFANLQADTWMQQVALMQARLALAQGNYETAVKMAAEAAVFFADKENNINLTRALILQMSSQIANNKFDAAAELGTRILHLANEANIPELIHRAHFLLGQIAEAQGDSLAAIAHYETAVNILQTLQNNLTITLRAGFLEDKNEPLHAALRLYLQEGQPTAAFELLEQSKSQALIGYLFNRPRLNWLQSDPGSQALAAELTQLREEHHALYRQVYESGWDSSEASEAILTAKKEQLDLIERRLRSITEQLYLFSADNNSYHAAPTPGLSDLQASLPQGAVLIEYYDDGQTIWAFVVAKESIQVHQLPLNSARLENILDKLYFNIKCALQSGPQSTTTRNLTNLARRLLQKLHDGLVAPLALEPAIGRLIVVPFGLTHYLPFNLLYDGQHYLIERFDLHILPAAGLLAQPGPQRPPGSLVMAHSQNGRLPHTIAEAKIVQQIMPGSTYVEAETRRDLLTASPVQVLHIAAHGSHRLDQPALSFIELADGQLFTDDLLQHDLSYELVVLSACETGQAAVKQGEELIGLGRGVLCAGAGALLASLWRVEDSSTMTLMHTFYQSLQAGAAKTAALQTAQQTMINEAYHPAFWGAFQLIGSAAPLSTTVD